MLHFDEMAAITCSETLNEHNLPSCCQIVRKVKEEKIERKPQTKTMLVDLNISRNTLQTLDKAST